MPESTARLRSLVADENGEGDASLDDRLAALDDLEERALDGRRSDLATLDALADETRYEALRLLAAADDGLAVCEVDAVLSVTGSAVSHALSALADAGLVERRKDGKWRYYRATERAEVLLDALDAGRKTSRNERAGDARENATRVASDE
jgi:DNA-binding transcriptional ArsR family regulator